LQRKGNLKKKKAEYGEESGEEEVSGAQRLEKSELRV